MSYQPGMVIPMFYLLSVSLFVMGRAERGRAYNGNWNRRSIGEDEFHFVELLAAPPVLCKRGPTCPAVTKAMGHDDGCGVLLDSGDYEGGRRGWRHFEVGRVVRRDRRFVGFEGIE